MIGRRTFKGRATVARSSYMNGKVGFNRAAPELRWRCEPHLLIIRISLQRRSYWVECWGAAEKPNGHVDPACITLSNLDEGPPMHHMYFDQMNRMNTPNNCTILIELLDETSVEIQVEEELQWRRWAKHIGLLLTIPHYPIPAEPSVTMPAEFVTDISPTYYDSNGGWSYSACNRSLNTRHLAIG